VIAPLLLRPLGPDDEAAFLRGVRAWDGEDLELHTFTWQPGMTHAEHLRRLDEMSRGVDVPPGFVPSTMLYGFVEGEIVGRVSVRHTLSPRLEQRGGHLGYAVAPAHRRHGFATEMVRQALPVCRRLGLGTILATCADDNRSSWRVLERLGAQLLGSSWDEEEEELVRRYALVVT
jgi:predicted acetyltransferase